MNDWLDPVNVDPPWCGRQHRFTVEVIDRDGVIKEGELSIGDWVFTGEEEFPLWVVTLPDGQFSIYDFEGYRFVKEEQ